MHFLGHSMHTLPPTLITYTAIRSNPVQSLRNSVLRPFSRLRASSFPLRRYMCSFTYCHVDPPVHGIEAHNVILCLCLNRMSWLIALFTFSGLDMSSFSVNLITLHPELAGVHLPSSLSSEQQYSTRRRFPGKPLPSGVCTEETGAGTATALNNRCMRCCSITAAGTAGELCICSRRCTAPPLVLFPRRFCLARFFGGARSFKRTGREIPPGFSGSPAETCDA